LYPKHVAVDVVTLYVMFKVRTGAIIIDFSKAFDLVPHDRLPTKIVSTRVDLRVVVWVKEFLLGRSQRVRVDEQLPAAREPFRCSTLARLC
jgi:hypothetical protein